MTRLVALVLLLALGAAVALRWPGLDQRPMHNDEAVNAIKFGRLWETGAYKYDPNEHHGPTLYYATLALGRLAGAPTFSQYTDTRLRLVTVLFGLGLILLLPLLTDGLGRAGMAWATLFTAVSPVFVFYSRYYVHETLLVFFTLLALGAGWRYWRTRSLGWILLAGAGVGLMAATKETFVLTLAAAALAVVLNQAWNRLLDASGLPVKAPPLNYWHLAAGFAVCLGVSLLFFTSFFSNASGPVDALRTYMPWFKRAGGESPHIHPWYFYLQHLLLFHAGRGPYWTEALILILAVPGTIAAFRRSHLADAHASFVRFIALYTFLLTAFYSLLPYKTPWCALGFWQGMLLLAGVGASVLVRLWSARPARILAASVLIAGAGHLAWESWLTDFKYAADRRNPYVYAQTSLNILELVERVEALSDSDPAGKRMLVKVMAPGGDYWPLPWYLRNLQQVGYWEEVPSDPFAPVMIVSAQLHARLDEKQTHLMSGYFELRPQVFLELYVEKGLWAAYLAKHPPRPDE
jgi:uncharacterized protein (TIGR03663 family)